MHVHACAWTCVETCTCVEHHAYSSSFSFTCTLYACTCILVLLALWACSLPWYPYVHVFKMFNFLFAFLEILLDMWFDMSGLVTVHLLSLVVADYFEQLSISVTTALWSRGLTSWPGMWWMCEWVSACLPVGVQGHTHAHTQSLYTIYIYGTFIQGR